MARLHEYQGKAILAANGFKIQRGRAVSNPDDAVSIAKETGGDVVVKIQAWTTGRAGIGGVAFAKKSADARGHAARMLSMKVGQFPVEAVRICGRKDSGVDDWTRWNRGRRLCEEICRRSRSRSPDAFDESRTVSSRSRADLWS